VNCIKYINGRINRFSKQAIIFYNIAKKTNLPKIRCLSSSCHNFLLSLCIWRIGFWLRSYFGISNDANGRHSYSLALFAKFLVCSSKYIYMLLDFEIRRDW